MNRGRTGSSGYTILETMIFLAVSGMLFFSAMALVSGRQARSEFTSTVREFELELTDIAGNVAAGYYTNTDNFTCAANPTAGQPQLTSAATGTQGQNERCVFMGRVIQFGPDAGSSSDAETYNIYTAVGRRYEENTSEKKDTENISTAKPVLIAPGTTPLNNSRPSVIDKKRLTSGVYIQKVTVGGTATQIGGFGFFSNLHVTNQGANTKSGSLQVDVVVPNPAVPSVATVLDEASTAFVNKMDNFSANSPLVNPSGGVVICLRSGGTSQHALISLGAGNTGTLTTTTTFGTGDCP